MSSSAVAGTSARSIVGALVAAEFSHDELITTMSSLDYTKFQDGGSLGSSRSREDVRAGHRARHLPRGLSEEVAG